jgi:hypothetical protein
MKDLEDIIKHSLQEKPAYLFDERKLLRSEFRNLKSNTFFKGIVESSGVKKYKHWKDPELLNLIFTYKNNQN